MRNISHLGQVLALNVRVLHTLFDHELYQDEPLTFYNRIKNSFIYIHTHTQREKKNILQSNTRYLW